MCKAPCALKSGRKVYCPVASFARFSESKESKMRAEHYEVFLDSLKLNPAIKEMVAAEGKRRDRANGNVVDYVLQGSCI